MRPNRIIIPALLVIGPAILGRAQGPCSISLGGDVTICAGQSTMLSLPAGYSNHLWSTGETTEDISVGSAGIYWGQVTYPSGELVTNGDFSGGNTAFWTPYTYSSNLQVDGNYYIGTNANNYHPQWNCTGNGNFLMVNSGYAFQWDEVWCQGVDVCPGQTYTLSFRMANLATSGPASLDWMVDWSYSFGSFTASSTQGQWNTYSTTWTAAPGQTFASFCLRVTSGWGIGNDIGLDDISISGNMVLRDTVQVDVTPLPVVDLGPDQTLCAGDPLVLDATQPGGSYLWQDGSTSGTYNVGAAGNYSVDVTVNGCTSSDAVQVSYTPLPVVDLGPDQTLCAGDPLVLDATQPSGSYLWQDGSTSGTYNVGAAGNYSVDVTVNGCTSSDAVQVNYMPLPVVDLGPDQTLCAGDPLVLDATQPGGSYLWQDGSTSGTYNVGAAGNYSVDVTVNGCTSSDAVQVSYTPLPVVDLGPDQTLCAGDPLVLDATQPSGSYLWQDGSTSGTYNVGAAGNYSVEVTVNGCTSSDAVQVSYTPLPVVDLGPDQTLCAGDPLVLDATQPGGSYLWQDGSTSGTYNVGAAGNYSVDVTVNGCTSSDAVQVSYTPLPVVDLGPDQTLCAGDPLVLDATQPSGSYLWQDGSTSGTYNVGAAGNYSVEVTVNGCTSSDAVQVSYTPLPVVDLGPDQTLCAGDPLVLDATQPGGSYLWQDGSTSGTYNVGAAGNYSVDVTVNGCTSSDAVQVSYTPLPVVDLGPDQTLCAGDPLVLDATQPGGSYLWQDGSTSGTYNVGAAGNYSVDVTVNGCTSSDAVQVSYTPLPVVDLGPDQTLCAGDPLVLDATQPGGSYLWQDGSTSGTYNVGAAGSYSVDVTVNGCTSSDAVQVSYTPLPVVDLGNDTTLCPGEDLLLDVAQPNNGVHWQDGATTSTYLVTMPGTYSVAVTGLNGCIGSDAITVAYAAPDAVDLGNDTTICVGASLILDAALPGASFLWNTGATTSSITVTNAGTYSVDVQQGTCSVSDAVQVSVAQPPSIELGNDTTLCPGEQLLLDATTTGATYLWQDGSSSATYAVLAPGTYSVQVTSSLGCASSDAVNIGYASPNAVDLGPDVTICQGGTLTLDATLPGGTYLWSTGANTPTLSVMSADTYWVQVGQGGCSVGDTIMVSVAPVPMADLGPDITLCAGDQTALSVNAPGATLLWSDGSLGASLDVSTAGAYWVQATIGQCSSSDTVVVNVLPAPSIDLGTDTSICSGASIDLHVGIPGAGTIWNTGTTGPDLSVNATGQYWADVTVGSCTATDTISITVLPPLPLDLGPDLTICDGAIAVLDATVPGATQLWSDGSTGATLAADAAGIYWVDVGLGNCVASDTILIAVQPLPVVDLGPDTTLCAGDALLLDASVPGATFLWQDGVTVPTRTVSSSGNYTVTVDLNGCTTQDAIEVGLQPLPDVDLGGDTTLCIGEQLVLGSIALSADHFWSDGSSGPTLLVQGPALVWLQESYQGCISTDTIAVSMLDPGALDLGADTTLCPGQSLLLTVDAPGIAVEWEDGSIGPTHWVDHAGTYSATASTAGCAASDAIIVDYAFVPAGFLGPDAILCPGDTLALEAPVGATAIDWSDGSTQPELLVTDAGTYALQATWNNCPMSDVIAVSLVDPPVVDLGPDLDLCEGEDLALSVPFANGSVAWSTGAQGASIHVDQPGTYTVQVSSDCGVAIDSVHVILIACGPYIHVPNAFTPDGDGHNDQFLPVIDGDLLDYTFDIFDRWGERIFTSTVPGEAWDGTVGGAPVPDGVYVWQLHYKALAHDGVKQDRMIGHVTLLR
ncbi:MAG: gliding motility-associated C-terminal domain-containing protein [Flavobacteriales bacterium]|nr:gliding motility-associated C-terminal domain-containing protein [Flavobacteriales bacterium]